MCLVCGSPEAEPHFGGISCRACAAFFRRYFHSKKVFTRCTCKTRDSNSHPCRNCRIVKCFAAGMKPEKVQACRDKHSMKSLENSPPDTPPSLLSARIVSRVSSNLTFAVSNWREFEILRDEMNGGKIGYMNIFQLSSTVRQDIELTWKMVYNLFPSTMKLRDSDKSALLRNFQLKLWQIEPILENIENAEKYAMMDADEFENLIVLFYEGTFPKGKEMSKAEILKIFQPIWIYYYTKMVLPIVYMDLERAELMAIIWLLFFDNGYTNISPDCMEMCRNIKKVILRELKNFQNEKDFDEMRFVETVETLQLIERGEQKFMEEMMICEMHNVKIHDDFKAILKESKL